MELSKKVLICILLLEIINIVVAEKKIEYKIYKKNKEYDRKLLRPFRMSKLNFVWLKAQSLLPDSKLDSLFYELKVQDKQEIDWKQVQGNRKDKDGKLKDEVRLKLKNIMTKYGLLEYFDESQNPEKTREYSGYRHSIPYEDKRLNRLWEKAQAAKFSAEELNSLTEQFIHHQDRIDMFKAFMEKFEKDNKIADTHQNSIDEKLEVFNEISKHPTDKDVALPMDLKKYESGMNDLREQNRRLKEHYERLESIVSSGPSSPEFIEPRAEKLWKKSLNRNLSERNLSELKDYLNDFQSRLLKLRHLEEEEEVQYARFKNEKNHHKSHILDEIRDSMKKQKQKVEILQESIEKLIAQHEEL